MLDPIGRQEVLDTILRLNREEGMTVVLVTHYMDEAVDADRIVVMDDGHIVMDDTPLQVFSRVDELRKLRLDVPQMAELAAQLREAGFNIPPDVLSVEAMVDALCRS
jgi:energy-coupling factor transport system ATP-binding protein